ncbi:MAG: hypothetical protein VW270_03885 [Candidatus Poseidoniales archaeon]|jgi:hypothetical protein
MTKKQTYGMRLQTILHAADKLSAELEYLCSLVEHPDAEFVISDALVYSRALVAISNQLEFISVDLSSNDLSDDGDHVILSEDEVMMLSTYNDVTEETIKDLEEVCGISLKNN